MMGGGLLVQVTILFSIIFHNLYRLEIKSTILRREPRLFL